MNADIQNTHLQNSPIQNSDPPNLDSQDSNFQQAYKDQLIAAGVHHHRAAEVAENLSHHELKVISEIWSKWGNTWQQLGQPAD